jgi:hypothetical protein
MPHPTLQAKHNESANLLIIIRYRGLQLGRMGVLHHRSPGLC